MPGQTDVLPLLLLALASHVAEPLPTDYATSSLHAFAAVANDRIVDGSAYTDGDGVVSAGLIFAGRAGFFASSELARLHGNGAIYPDAALLTLESAVGWQFVHADNRFSLVLLDYRLFHDGSHDHRGMALDFRRGGFAGELAVERDKPYSYDAYDYSGLLERDIRRGAVSWTAAPIGNLRWYVGAGAKRFASFDMQQEFVTAGLLLESGGLEWQLGVSRASGDLEAFGGTDPVNTQLLFRVAKTFRLLP